MKKTKNKITVSTFKRWTRKRFAAFSSLHKVVKIGVIAGSCTFLTLPTKGNEAQQHDGDSLSRTILLSPIEITAEELLQDESLSTNNINATINRKEILRLPVQSLSEALENLPGLDIRQRGPLNTQADISYRGGTFEQTVVLLNGINFSDPQTGHYLLNLPFGADAIQRINLFSNTTSYLFGTSPFSGLINIITSPRAENRISLHAMGGMHGLHILSASTNTYSKGLRQFITVGNEKSSGYIENTDFKHSYIFYHGIADFNTGKLEFQAGYTDRAYGANGFYSLKFPNQYDHTKTFISSLRWENRGAVKFIPSVYYRYNSDCFQLIKNTNTGRNDHITQVLGGNIRGYFDSRIGRSSASIDLRIEDILSNILGEELTTPIAINETENLFYKKGKTRAMSALSLSQAYRYQRFSVNATLLLQKEIGINYRNIGHDGKPILLPAADISYQLPSMTLWGHLLHSKTTLSAASAVRRPTFLDLYYDSPYLVGNIALNPEKARTLEWGNSFSLIHAETTDKIIEGNSNIFVRYVDNMIDYTKNASSPNSIWVAMNHNKILFVGLNLSGSLFPQHIWGKSAYVTQLTLQYDYLYSDQEASTLLSRYVLDHTEHKFTGKLSHDIYRGFEASWTTSYNKRKGGYTAVNGLHKDYQPFWLLDGRVSYTYKQIKVYVEATNILNKSYFDFGDLIQPGRWIRGGVSYNLQIN